MGRYLLPPARPFQHHEEYTAAVQHRYGQDVQDGQVDTEQDAHAEPTDPTSVTGDLPGDLSYADGTRELGRRAFPEGPAQGLFDQHQHLPSIDEAVGNGLPDGFGPFDDGDVVQARKYAHQPPGRLGVEPGPEVQQQFLATALHQDRHLRTAVQVDLAGEFQPVLDVLAVGLKDHIFCPHLRL